MRYRDPVRQQRSVGRSLIVLVLVLLIAAAGAWVGLPRLRSALAHTPLTARPHATSAAMCRSSNVLAGVYNPGRLRVQAPCLSAFGHVALILHAPDGDIHISLLPDRGYWHLLDRRNYSAEGGMLVVEVVPADQRRVALPHVGDHVRVTGAYVTDLEWGWREIHPTWQIVPASY